MNKPVAIRSWRVSLAMTLATWLAAFAVATALFEVFGDHVDEGGRH
jgi:hypothetical protein